LLNNQWFWVVIDHKLTKLFWKSQCWFRLNYRLYGMTNKIIIWAMKYMSLIDNFVMVVKFDELRCLLINLMNSSYCYDFVDKLCTLINAKISINKNCILLCYFIKYLVI
jgi:hypothetical protein